MRLVSYHTAATGPRFGRVVGADDDLGIIDGVQASEQRWSSLRAVLAAGAIAELAEATEGRPVDLALAEVELLPPIPDPGKIVCAGVNYRAHRAEAGRTEAAHPTLFTRFADSQIGHRSPALKPAVTDRFDYEGELAVVIGSTGHQVSLERAWSLVAGYACYNDFSVRDWQRHTTQWLPGKNFPGTGAFGPWLRTADEVPDVCACTLQTMVNGEVRQDASLTDLIFSIPELLVYISTFTRLEPGDVVVTGTPGGVGLFRDPPTFLEPGDLVEVDISGVGRLVNEVVSA